MNICKIYDLSPGTEMSSWGTIHLAEEKRIVEWVVNVANGHWHSMGYSPCLPAPEGGFTAIREGQEELFYDLAKIDPRQKVEIVCKENVSEDLVVRLVLGELLKSGFPRSVEEEARHLRKMLRACGSSLEKREARRFQVD
jgi:hypothetical protein